MSEWKNFKKIYLKILASELGKSDTIAKIVLKKIESIYDLDKDFELAQAINIPQDRGMHLAEEKERKRLEKEDQDKDRTYELEKLKLWQEAEMRSTASNHSVERNNK